MSEDTQEQAEEVGTAPEEKQLAFDPKAVEADMIRMAQERADDPTEVASQAYQMYVPHFKRALPKLSTRGLRRLINYMVLYPLEQEDFKAANEFEKEMMHLVNSLVEAKFVMLMDTYRSAAEQLYQASQTPLTAEEEAEVIAQFKAAGVTDEDLASLKTVDNQNTNSVESTQGE